MLKDVLIRYYLDVNDCRGQSYDGASNMAGIVNGVQRKILNYCPLAYYTHCGAHRTNLIAQKISNNEFIIRSLQIVNNIGNLFQSTIKFRNILKNNSSTLTIRPLFPTRWTVRKYSVEKFLLNYSEILKSLYEFESIRHITSEQQVICRLYKDDMLNGNTFLNLTMILDILIIFDKHTHLFMTTSSTLEIVLNAIAIAKEDIQNRCNNYKILVEKAKINIANLNLDEIIKPRESYRPTR